MVNGLRVNGAVVETAAAGTLAEIDVPKGVRLNDRVFRTLDSELMAYAGQFYGEKNKKRIPVTATVIAHEGSLRMLTATPVPASQILLRNLPGNMRWMKRLCESRWTAWERQNICWKNWKQRLMQESWFL